MVYLTYFQRIKEGDDLDPMAWIWVFGIAIGLILIASMAPNLLLKLGGKIQEGGTVESSRQARKVVTIEDVAERKFYTLIEREPRGEGVHKLKLLNLDTRTIEYRDQVTAERLKINPFEVGDTGFVNIRLLPLENFLVLQNKFLLRHSLIPKEK